MELWGRAEDIVPLPVFRANRRAVEIRLRSHPAVAEAAVIVQPQFVAYAVLKPGARTTENELRVFLRGGVAEPSAVVILEALPKDTDGKIVAEKLPAPVAKTTGGAPLQGILHQQLAEIWRDILKVPDLGLDDNFFECGGNSFLALRMMMRAEKLCRRPLPLSLLLTGATISNLAPLHHRDQRRERGRDGTGAGAAEGDAPAPLFPPRRLGRRRLLLHPPLAAAGRGAAVLRPAALSFPGGRAARSPGDGRPPARGHREAVAAGPLFRRRLLHRGARRDGDARQWTAQGKTVAHLFSSSRRSGPRRGCAAPGAWSTGSAISGAGISKRKSTCSTATRSSSTAG